MIHSACSVHWFDLIDMVSNKLFVGAMHDGLLMYDQCIKILQTVIITHLLISAYFVCHIFTATWALKVASLKLWGDDENIEPNYC